MKNITLLLLIALMGCSTTPKNESVTAPVLSHKLDTTKFEWLNGVWERSMRGDASINHFETWSTDSNGFTGTGITIINDDITEEKMWLFKRNDSVYYKAHPQQNETPTLFHITEIKDSFFRSENKRHDFPKFIEYQRQGDSLFAYIGDENQRITFKFKKQHERDIR